MKTTAFIVTLFLFLSTFIGCKKTTTDDGLPYYQFTDNDKLKLVSSLTNNSILKYKNQDNDTINFYVRDYQSGKTDYSTGTFSGGNTTYFHYDRQKILMQYTTQGYTWSDCEINIEKYPVGSNYQTQYPIVGTPTFRAYMTFPLWNGFNGTDTFSKTINIDFGLSVSSMTINSKTYNSVRMINSNKLQTLEPNILPPAIPRNVNVIYYDQNAGIIGFDDLNGKNWRLQ